METSNLNDFAGYLRAHNSFDWQQDYDRLWQWSVDNSAEFWAALWDWHGIIGDKGERLVVNNTSRSGHVMFFPDGQVNYAENMLADADDTTGFIGYGEDGRCTRLSRAEIKQKSLALAGWMKSRGISKGDRVAAYVPNCDIALISMLATASLGAIFQAVRLILALRACLTDLARLPLNCW